MTEENKKRGLPKYENPPPPPKRKVKTAEQIAKSFVDEMQEYGLSYEQMLEVIALAKVKLILIKSEIAAKNGDFNSLLKMNDELRAAKEELQGLKHQLDVEIREKPVLNRVISDVPKEKTTAKDMNFIDVQVSCNKCHEIIIQDKCFVKFNKNGAPEESELKRVFSYPELNAFKKCPCCDNSNFEKGYKYEPSPVSSENYIDENDLPF